MSSCKERNYSKNNCDLKWFISTPAIVLCCVIAFVLFMVTIQSRKYPLKGETIQYIYTDSKHNNPLCRVTPIEDIKSIPQYDKEKYKEMILDAAETVLGFLALIGLFIAIPRGMEGNGDGMKN